MAIPAERYEDRIWAKVPYSLKAVADGIPGRRLLKRPTGWVTTFPLTMDTCHALRAAFGPDLQVGTHLAAWAREEIARLAELENFRDGSTPPGLARVQELAPTLYAVMANRTYQLDGTAFLAAAGQSCLGDQPGLGKTLQGLAAIVETGAQRVLISCPQTATRSVWVNETARWLGDLAVTYLAQGTRAHRTKVIAQYLADTANPADGKIRMLIINNEMVRIKRFWVCPDGSETAKAPGRKGGCMADHKHTVTFSAEYDGLFAQPWEAIILDESHHLLASTYNVQSANITQSRLGAVRLPRTDGALVIAMSGTPFRSKLERAWGTLNWLYPSRFSSYWAFAKEHFQVSQGRYGMELGPCLDMDRLTSALRPYYLARTKPQVAPDLPPITYAGTPLPEGDPEFSKGIWLEMGPEQAKAYAEMAADAETRLESGTLTAVGTLAELTRLRQFACSYLRAEGDSYLAAMPSNKIDWLLQFLSERDGYSGKVVVASQFSGLIATAARALIDAGHEVMILTGETTGPQRARIQERFQSEDDKCRVLILNTHAGGESITLDACCDDLVMLDEPWTSDAIEQVEARIHRISRMHSVTVWRLRSIGTVDAWIAGLTDAQRADISTVKPATLKGATAR